MESKNEVPTLMTADEVAAALRISRRSVDLWSQDGRLPAPIRVQGRPRWDAAVITEWLNAQGAGK